MFIGLKFNVIFILLFLLFFCAVRDLKEGIIPNRYLIRGIAIRFSVIIYEVFADEAEAIMYFFLRAIISILILGTGVVIRKMTHNGIGMGDLKLFSVMFLYMDIRQWLMAVFCSFGVGIVVAVFVNVHDRQREKIPFAPAIFIGTIIVVIMS